MRVHLTGLVGAGVGKKQARQALPGGGIRRFCLDQKRARLFQGRHWREGRGLDHDDALQQPEGNEPVALDKPLGHFRKPAPRAVVQEHAHALQSREARGVAEDSGPVQKRNEIVRPEGEQTRRVPQDFDAQELCALESQFGIRPK